MMNSIRYLAAGLRSRRRLLLLQVIDGANGLTPCAGKNPCVVDLMPAPVLFMAGKIDPFGEIDGRIQAPYRGMLYATDRKPTPETGTPFYLNERGFDLHRSENDPERSESRRPAVCRMDRRQACRFQKMGRPYLRAWLQGGLHQPDAGRSGAAALHSLRRGVHRLSLALRARNIRL